MTSAAINVSARREQLISIRSSRFILDDGAILCDLQRNNRVGSGIIFRKGQNYDGRNGQGTIRNFHYDFVNTGGRTREVELFFHFWTDLNFWLN